MLLVIGSKHSLFPKICDVLAVGIGASNREFRRPCCFILSFKLFQLYIFLRYTGSLSVGSTFHISNCKMPFDAGEPINVSYEPQRNEISIDACNAA